MCGFAGWAARESSRSGLLDLALDQLASRGPDGRGSWRSSDARALLGHTRLAIQDPSARGAQPFVAPNGLSAFVHVGEIYNFRELRVALQALGEGFESESDGEVAHRLLDLEGPSAIDRFEGMFALAHWSERDGRLLLARDRLGIKPLYYASVPSGIAFASQPKALLALPAITARLDPIALSDYLAYGYVPLDRSIFAGIHKLPPAHWLRYQPETGSLEIRRFWSLRRRTVRDDPEELRDRLRQAVASHLVSDVPVGAFLSGGLDSTTVVALASRQLSALPTFAVAYADGDLADVAYARVAARQLDTQHRDRLLEVGCLEDALAQSAEIYDEPLYDPRALAMLELSRLARQKVKVVLSGDGGDEVFGGYGWHLTALRYEKLRSRFGPFAALLPLLHAGLLRPAARIARLSRLSGGARLLACDFPSRYFPVRGFFNADEQERVLGRRPEDPAWLLRHFDRPDLPLVHRLLFLDLHTYLPDNGLAIVDRSTMSLGLEARVPLLDTRLLEHAFSLPPEKLAKIGQTKIAFREAVVPWIPAAIRTRPKKGFSPPFKRWISGPGRQAALRYLETGRLASDGVLRPRGVRALIEGGAQRRPGKLWLLLCLETWYRRWILGEAASDRMAAA